jgi:hypothetical protein
MTLTEIVDLCEKEYGNRFQVKRADVIKLLDQIQKIAFNRDLAAFLVWNSYVTGIIAGTKGPYAFPTVPPVRKLLGVTKVSDRQYFGDRMGTDEAYDYGLLLNYFDERKEYMPGRVDIFARTFTFIEEPETAANTYRWIYFRRAPTITGTDSTNEANLLIPEEFHFTSLVQGVGALSDNLTYGDKTPEEVLEPYLQPFWTSVTELSTGIGEGSLGLSEGQL